MVWNPKKNQLHAVQPPAVAKPPKPVSPRAVCKAAVSRLTELAFGPVVADYNHATGVARLITTSGGSLFNIPYTGNARKLVDDYLTQSDTIKACGLKCKTLVAGETAEFNYGTRVGYAQQARVPGFPNPLPVLGGFIHGFVTTEGHLISVANSLRPGFVPKTAPKIVAATEAIATAVQAHKELRKAEHPEVKSCTLWLSSHELPKGKHAPVGTAKSDAGHIMEPTYVVYVKSEEKPLHSHTRYLVDAKTGKVVDAEETLIFMRDPHQALVPNSGSRKAAVEPPCKYFPITPDPNVDLKKQVIDYMLPLLDDPKLLANRFILQKTKQKGVWTPVAAKKDGSWDYDIDSDEFEAMVALICITEAMVLQEKHGMPRWPRQVVGMIHDSTVQDNAYWSTQDQEYHTGEGSGLKNGGLSPRIALDKMVDLHEVAGHGGNSITAPGGNLRGSQGRGLEEKKADEKALLKEYYDRAVFASRIGVPFGVAEVQADPRIIGPYSLIGGIRTMRNTAVYPKDWKGEPHDDSLMPGGAGGDIIEAIIVMEGDVVKGVEILEDLSSRATALSPANTTTFMDERRCYLTVDANFFGGKYKAIIEKAYDNHGIKATAAQTTTGQGKGKKKKGPKKSPKKPGGGNRRSPNRRRPAA